MTRGNLRAAAGFLAAVMVIAVLDFLKPGVATAPDFTCQSSDQGSVNISISAGETGASIAQSLAREGVVKSSSAFFRIAVADQRSAAIAPGIHRIDREICAADALEQLLDPKRIINLLAINEGLWVSEISEKLVSLGYSATEVARAIRSVELPTGFKSLEGLLFPARYSFEDETPVSSILNTLIKRSRQEMERAGFFSSSTGFTANELLIIASLVEAEGDPIDYPKVSQVVRNRLRIGMPLQFDSTVHYVMKERGSIFLSTKSTLLSSPFNTYQNRGLPPSPINNPGAAAMRAAVDPAQGDWLYFITVAPNDTRFTADFSQFNEWKVIYKRNLRSGKFG